MQNHPINCQLKWKNLLIFGFFTIVLLAGTKSNAQENNNKIQPDTLHYSWDRFSVRLGAFFSGLNSDIQLSSQNLGLGLIVNVEDALGLQTSTFAFRGDSEYNFGKRKRSTVKLDYFSLIRSAEKVLGSDIEIGDNIFPIGTKVNSQFNLRILKGTYAYSFYQDRRVNLNVNVGLFIMPISFSTTALGISDELAQFVAPLPVLGFGTDIAITSKLYLKQNIDVLYLDISNFTGSITDVNIKLEYNPWKHFGFGGGLNAYQLKIDAYNDNSRFLNFKGSIKTGYTGLLLYVKYYLR